MSITALVRISVVVGVGVVGVARIASADCTATIRPPTAEEKSAYANGYAMFQRMAPPAPAGWSYRDSTTNADLKDVCAEPGQKVLTWSFSRSFTAPEAELAARRDAAVKQVEAVGQQAQSRAKANEKRLAEIERQREELTKKMTALMTAKPPRLDQIEQMTQEAEKLQNEEMKLRGFDGLEAALKPIDRDADRDAGATFRLASEADVTTSGWTPLNQADGAAFRQSSDRNGNPWTDILVVLNPAAGPKALKTTVRISGNPARADALLKASKLR